MTTTNALGPKRYVRAAETAKYLRAALKTAFPGQRFSVRTDTYSGGASIRVRYVDGPKIAEVEKVASLYAGCTFDGMTDSKEYHGTLLAGPDGEVEHVQFGAHFVFVDRDLSPDLTAKAAIIVRIAGGDPDSPMYQEVGYFAEGATVATKVLAGGGYALVRQVAELI